MSTSSRRRWSSPIQHVRPQAGGAHLLKLYDDIGLGLTVWSPLASGLLTGKHNDGIAPDSRAALQGYEWIGSMFEAESGQEQIEKVRRLTPIAEELGGTMAQFALAWCLREDYVSSVITGASRPEQVVENMKALDVLGATPRDRPAGGGDPRQPPGGAGELPALRVGRSVLVAAQAPATASPAADTARRRPRTGGAQ